MWDNAGKTPTATLESFIRRKGRGEKKKKQYRFPPTR